MAFLKERLSLLGLKKHAHFSWKPCVASLRLIYKKSLLLTHNRQSDLEVSIWSGAEPLRQIPTFRLILSQPVYGDDHPFFHTRQDRYIVRNRYYLRMTRKALAVLEGQYQTFFSSTLDGGEEEDEYRKERGSNTYPVSCRRCISWPSLHRAPPSILPHKLLSKIDDVRTSRIGRLAVPTYENTAANRSG